jgi:hypothetical protein
MLATPTVPNRIYILFRDLKLRGPRGMFGLYAGKIQRRFGAAASKENPLDESFDAQFGVDTSRAILPSDLCIVSNARKWGVHYAPTETGLFEKMMEYVRADLRDYTFVDLGSGKGSVLLRASEYPFRKIIGVEYSRSLVDIANTNIARYRSSTQRCCDIKCVCGDARDFTVPSEPIVLYLFNPFQGKVMDEVVKRLKESLRQRPRDLWLIYLVPWEHRKFKRTGLLRTIESNCRFCVYHHTAVVKLEDITPNGKFAKTEV